MRISFDGVSLNDEPNGIQARYPEDLGAPPVRGDDVVVPFRHGAVPTRKYYAPRSIVINGYIWAHDRAVLWQRVDQFKALFDVTRGPRRLEVAWPDGTKRYLLAEPRNTLGLSGEHKTFTPFSVEFVAAEPFWRDDAAAQEPIYRMSTRPAKRLGDPTLLMADFDSAYDAYTNVADTYFPIPNPGFIAVDDADLRIKFTYAATAIDLRCLESNTGFRIAHPFAANGTLQVDCRTWRAWFGTATDRPEISERIEATVGQRAPLILPPGQSTVRLVIEGGPAYGARIEFRYASAYL